MSVNSPTATISIVPKPAYTKDALTVSATVTSFEPGSTALRYEWFRNQTLVPEETTNSINSARTSKGEIWKVLVTPSDGLLDGPRVPLGRVS